VIDNVVWTDSWLSCNTLKFLDFRMLIGRIIKITISHNFINLPNIYFLYRKFSEEDWLFF
jgi:hypothetical protein